MLRITALEERLYPLWMGQRVTPESKHLEVTLETEVESVNLAEEMCLRVAEAAGFGEDECYRIGMSVREGVINAFHYGNQERPGKKIYLAVDLTQDKMIIHVVDEGRASICEMCRILWPRRTCSALPGGAYS
jgi:anti-sigma regulatory factor (Ser/Thr protein kinase)